MLSSALFDDLPHSFYESRLWTTHNLSPNILRQLSRLQIGTIGEQAVAKIALKEGWTLLGQQLRGRGYELDLVIKRKEQVKVLEIKTRLEPKEAIDFSRLITWVNPKKRSSMTRGTLALTQKNKVSPFDHIVIDLVSVDLFCKGTMEFRRWGNIFA